MPVPINEDLRIVDEQNNSQVEVEKIEEAFHFYYTNLFTSVVLSNHDISLCVSGIQKKVDPSMNSQLLKSFTKEEMEVVLNQMAPLMSLEPDGFGAVLYQKH